MNIINRVLSKIIIQDFYKRNAWWLLMLFMAFFGLVKNPVILHKEIMYYIQSSSMGLSAYILLTFLYSGHVILFQNAVFQKQENLFLQHIRLRSCKKKIAIFCSIQVGLLLPVLVYSLFTLFIGIQHQFYRSAGILTLSSLFSLFVCVYSSLRNINGNYTRQTIFNKIRFPLPGFFSAYLLNYMWREQRKKLVWIKIASLLILSIPLVRNQDNFQLSDFNIFWAASLSTNLILLYDIFVFFNTRLRFMRQIPISVYHFYLQLLLTCVVILVPECLLTWVYRNGLSGINVMEFSVYSIGVLLLLYNIQWDRKSDLSNFMGTSSLVLTGLLFLAAYKIFLLVGIICAVLSFVLFNSNYYQYEYQVDDNKTMKK